MIECKLHGDTTSVLYDGRIICSSCLLEYEANIVELEKIGKETLLTIHEAVGRALKDRLQDPEAFDRLKVATREGLDVIATYNQIVNDVCKKIKMN